MTYAIDRDMRSLAVIGGPGSGAVVGRGVEFVFPRALALTPWSERTILVTDWGGNRVLEVHVGRRILERVSTLCSLGTTLTAISSSSRTAHVRSTLVSCMMCSGVGGWC